MDSDRRPMTVLADLVERAASSPHVAAVTDAERSLTYDTLVRAAGGVARPLAELATVREDAQRPIPVVVGRDVESVVALLGVWFVGRPFVAVERTDPPARIADICARVDARAIVVTGDPAEVSAPPTLARVDVATTRPTEGFPDAASVAPDDLAAVIYTSGSTGRPKGVCLDHGNVAAMQEWAVKRAAEGRGPSPALAPFSFLAGLTNLTQIAAGERADLVTPSAWDPLDLLEWFDEKRFRNVSVVPSFARHALERWPEGRCLEHVRRLGTYGEALRWSDVPALRRLAPNASVAVSYGASEVGGAACSFVIAPDDPLGTGPMPLGTPRPGRTISLEPVDGEPGAPCQIVVHGVVATGYWGDDELTAARFGVDEHGVRFWRSGDLGEWVDGQLVHRGRVDDLVKINGRLVEPAEAERVLGGLPGVVQVAVMGQQVGADLRLVAHVEPARRDGHDAVGPQELRAAVAEVLPGHLVPSVFVRHDRLPANDRGKVDRAGLAASEVVPWRSGPYVAPVPELEWVIVGHVLEILGLDDETLLGRDDDVFALGLDSLGATELLAALADDGLASLTPADLLDHPTPRLLAERCARPVRRRGPVVFNGAGSRPAVVAVAGAGGTALAYRDLARHLGEDQPLVVLENPGLHDGRELAATVPDAASALLVDLIARQEPAVGGAGVGDAPLVLMGHSWGGLVAYEMAHRLGARGADVRLVLLDTAVLWEGSAAERARARVARAVRDPRRVVGSVRHRAGRLRRARPDPDPRVEPDRRDRSGGDAPRGEGDEEGRAVVARYMDAFVAGIESGRRYRPPRARVPVTLVTAERSTVARGWAGLVDDLTVVSVTGTHNSMLTPPHTAGLAEALAPLLAAPASR